jgi:pre-mRNA-splicing factor ATP-dependent RNA helicase DHX16
MEVLRQGGALGTGDSVKSFAQELFFRAQDLQQKKRKHDAIGTKSLQQLKPNNPLIPSLNNNHETMTGTSKISSQPKVYENKDRKFRHRRQYQVEDDSGGSSSSSSEVESQQKLNNIDDGDESFTNETTTATATATDSIDPKKKSFTTAFTDKELQEIRRQQDIQERDEFAKRLSKKDKERTTQKVAQEDIDYHDSEVDRGTHSKALPEADQADIVEKLREKSRRTYLKKREERELTLLEQSLKDEEELFATEKMTQEERKRIELQKQILEMATKRKRREEGFDVEGELEDEDRVYRLPDEEYDRKVASKADQDNKLLMARYVEGKHEKTEQELWEESQTKKGGTIATHRKKNRNIPEQQEYDYVFDEEYQIDFVMGRDGIKGYDNREKLTDTTSNNSSTINTVVTTKPVTEYQRLQEGRKQLPVYAYRDEFLAALRDHQGKTFSIS